MRKIISFTIIIGALLFLTAGTALADDAFKPSNASDPQTALATILTGVVTVLFLMVCAMLVIKGGSGRIGESGKMWPILLLAIILAVAMRLVTAAAYPGYATDIACFKGWAAAVYNGGPANFYTSGIFADYPPGYMYVLYVLEFIRSLFSIDSGSALFTMIIKLPSIIAEVVLALIAYKIAAKRQDKTFALLGASFILFNPALFFNSSVWGQIDAVFVLFIVLALYYLKKENGILGALFFAIALLIKPQAIIFAPVVGLAYVYALFKKGSHKKAIVHLLGGTAVAAALVALAVLPFTGTQEPLWIFAKYQGTIDHYQYASLNAFNLYAMLGSNWVPSSDPFLLLNYQTWGMIFILLICVSVVFLQWRTRDSRPLFDLSAFLVLSVFMLAHAMHERYIVPASVLLIFAYFFSHDRTTLLFAAGFTLTTLLNQMVTLYAQSVMTPPLPTIVISAVNMAMFVAYAIVTSKKLVTRTVMIKSPALHR